MYQHYTSKTVSGEELDRLLGQAAAQERERGLYADLIVVEEVGNADDAAIDRCVINLLDALCEPSDGDVCRYALVDGGDVLQAVDELGLTLGTVYECAERDDKVIKLDDQAHSDAQAWATVSALPSWVQERYRKLVVVADAAKERPAA
jgi:hypothetical protein